MKLWIEGVDEHELQFGLAAAQGVLTVRGVSPFEGAAAWFKIEGEREDLSDEEHRAAEAWCDAQDAAAWVCCGQKAHAVRLTLELTTTGDGEIWVGQRPNGHWGWEALIDRRPGGAAQTQQWGMQW